MAFPLCFFAKFSLTVSAVVKAGPAGTKDVVLQAPLLAQEAFGMWKSQYDD